MQEAAALDAPATRPADFDLASYRQRSAAEFRERLPRFYATFLVEQGVLKWARYRCFAHGARARQFSATLERMADSEQWPSLPLNEWLDTCHTLQRWVQIAGKIRMALAPPLNHWWHVTLYVNSRGLTTGPVPYTDGAFEIQFDFLRHELQISASRGVTASRLLEPEPVAVFYRRTIESLASLGISVEINRKPQEVPDPILFDEDYTHHSYDPEYARRFWRILLSSARVLEKFRGRYLGKSSPVHFFWGSFDLACTRFSGRTAPPRAGVITGPAYSHELSSAGFWPGGGGVDGPAYYSYTVPKPAGLELERVRPSAARWHPQLSEFILMYDDVRQADSPEQALYEFLESTYDAGARLGGWDRAALEIGLSPSGHRA